MVFISPFVRLTTAARPQSTLVLLVMAMVNAATILMAARIMFSENAFVTATGKANFAKFRAVATLDTVWCLMTRAALAVWNASLEVFRLVGSRLFVCRALTAIINLMPGKILAADANLVEEKFGTKFSGMKRDARGNFGI